jgi:aminoglycoside phosphotransferase (APT) family kinase protein
MTLHKAEIIEALRGLARAHGIEGSIDVSGLQQVRGGNSSEIWMLEARWCGHGKSAQHELIVRCGMGNEFGFAGRTGEVQLLKALQGTPVPAPRIWWFDGDGSFFGRPTMVMERCNGVADRFLLTEHNKLELTLEARVALANQIVDLLVKTHTVDVNALPIENPDSHVIPAALQLSQHDAAVARLEAEPMMELRAASWWLWRHLPPECPRLTIVHGDFRPANMLVEGGQVVALLDWEFAHIGDPVEDLGWYLSPYYATEHLIPGCWDYQDVLLRYERSTGVSVDRARLEFWTIFSMYKLAYMTVAALRWMVDGDPARMATSAEFIIGRLLSAIGASCTARRQPRL